MKNKFDNIKKDQSLLQSDVIILTETWLDEEQDLCYNLHNFTANFNNGGRGKGIATYFDERFTHKKNIKKSGLSVTKITSRDHDIIGVYRSQEGDKRDLINILKTLIDGSRSTIIGGDFNVCILKEPDNIVSHALKEKGFLQIVKTATHEEGGGLDHVYINQVENKFSWDIEYFPKYYSDHDGVGLTLWSQNQDTGKEMDLR